MKAMHTNEKIQRAAELAEELDPAGVPVDDTTDLRTLVEAVDTVSASTLFWPARAGKAPPDRQQSSTAASAKPIETAAYPQ